MSSSKKPKRSPFKRRYVLGEGYPWALGCQPYYEVQLNESTNGVNALPLTWPLELWQAHVPRYRLVLERVREKGKGKG